MAGFVADLASENGQTPSTKRSRRETRGRRDHTSEHINRQQPVESGRLQQTICLSSDLAAVVGSVVAAAGSGEGLGFRVAAAVAFSSSSSSLSFDHVHYRFHALRVDVLVLTFPYLPGWGQPPCKEVRLTGPGWIHSTPDG